MEAAREKEIPQRGADGMQGDTEVDREKRRRAA